MFKTKSQDLSLSERAYRFSVKPLAILLLLNGIGLVSIINSWPAEHLSTAPIPFIESAQFKKYFLIFIGLFNIMLGIGLYLRSRLIWYAFIAYLVVGPAWLILGMLLGYFPSLEPKNIIIPISVIVSVGLAFGLYFVTKPAFIKAP